MKLSPRLRAIIEMVPPLDCLADIGSDHAYVPIALIQQQRIRRAIASEIASGPLKISQRNIQAAHLQQQITTRLADGLSGISSHDQVDLAVIAGMGGQLITQILERSQSQLHFISQLILEPNNDEPFVRQWLSQYHWQIKTERIVQEGRHIYEIIYAQKQANFKPLTPQQVMFGPCLLKERSQVFRNKWQRQLQQAQLMYNNLLKANRLQPQKLKQAQAQIQKIKEVLQ